MQRPRPSELGSSSLAQSLGFERQRLDTVQVLDEDPDLAENLAPHAIQQATELLRAVVFRVPKGPWRPPEIDPGAMGLLILDGLMVRTLRLGPVSSSELVGPTDIIRPWENDLIPAVQPTLAEWRVLHEARVAVLDPRTTALIGRWPELTSAFAGRLLRRSRSLAFLMAAQHFVKATDRMLATLWHLACMWGRVTPAGTVVPFRLTHAMLANIIGSKRPTATLAVQTLERRGRLFRDAQRRYVLLGDAPDWNLERPRAAELEI